MSTWVLISVEIVFLFYVFLLFCVLAFLLGFQCFHHNIVFPVFVGCCLAKTSVFFTVVGWLLSNERNPMCSSGFGCFFHKTLVFLMLVVACICFLTKALVVLRCLRVFSEKKCFPYVLGWFHSNTLVFSRCLATVLYFLAKAATNLRNTNVSSQTP